MTEIGRQTAQGCKFSGAGKGDGLSDTIRVVDEYTYRASDCMRTLSVAEYPTPAIPSEVQKDLSDFPVFETRGESKLLATSWSKSLLTWVTDPIAIRVSKTSTLRSWNSSGGYSGMHYRATDAANTGWTITGYTPIDTASYSDTIARFQNVAFCLPTVATYSNHNETRISTSRSGSWSYSYNMYKWGDCSALLSYHYAVY